MSEKYLKYVNDFITGDIDHLIDMFDSMENILRFFHKKDLLQYIDPFDTDVEDYQLEILNYLLNVVNDKETLKYCIAQLSDVIPADDGYYNKLKKPTIIHGLVLHPFIVDDRIIWEVENPNDVSYSSTVIEGHLEEMLYEFLELAGVVNREKY